MKKNYCFSLLIVLILCSTKNTKITKMDFWNETRRGANNFNKVPIKERFFEAKKFGIKLIRLTPSKWVSSKKGHFLINDLDNYTELNIKDLEKLKEVLSWANEAEIKIVLTFIALPNYKWSQQNDGIQDRRLFEDFKYQNAAINFWKDLADKLKYNKTIIAYNILNEPSPELAKIKLKEWYTDNNEYEEWYNTIKGTPQDLNLFYKKIIQAIRSVDKETPIILKTGYFANAWGIKIMEKYKDPNVLYSFHMYEPYCYTSMKGKSKYNSKVFIGQNYQKTTILNKEFFKKYFKPVVEWQKKNKINSKKIFLGEFGGRRKVPNINNYFKDLLTYVEKQGWHWAFYSFREDEWDGMDYEWGPGRLPYKEYWKRKENEESPIYPKTPNSLFNTIINFIPKK